MVNPIESMMESLGYDNFCILFTIVSLALMIYCTKSNYPLILTIIALNVFMLIITQADDNTWNEVHDGTLYYGMSIDYKLGLYTNLELLDDQPWTIYTNMFVHANFLHLFFNLWVLFLFGTRLETEMDKQKLLFIYLLAGLGAGFLQTGVDVLMDEPHLLVGASGAISGMLALYAYLRPNDKFIFFPLFFPITAASFVIFYALFNFLLGVGGAVVAGGAGIAYFGHLGGLITGYALAPLLLKGGKGLRFPKLGKGGRKVVSARLGRKTKKLNYPLLQSLIPPTDYYASEVIESLRRIEHDLDLGSYTFADLQIFQINLQKLLSRLRCPSCGGSMVIADDEIGCERCEFVRKIFI